MGRQRRVYETPEYAAMVRRVLAAHGRRVGRDGDEVDLAELVAMRGQVDQAIAAAVEGMRRRRLSWSYIAAGLGTSKQAAAQWYGRRTGAA